MPQNESFLALVEEVTEKSRERLMVLDIAVTHVVHILRTSLAVTDPAVDIDDVVEITRGDTSESYRVKYFRDDQHKPQVEFHCALA